MKLSRTSIVIATMLSAGAIATTGFSQERFGRNHENRGHSMRVPGIQKLESAVGYLVNASNARGFQKKSNLRRAYYSVKMAKMELDRSRGVNYKVLDELATAAEKLNDRYLSDAEKVNWGLNCVGFAVGDLLQSSRNSRGAAMIMIRIAQKVNESCLFDVVANYLEIATDIVGQTGNYGAVEAVEVALEKATDR